MKLYIDIKPTIVKADTKDELLSKIQGYRSHYIGSSGVGLSSMFGLRVYSAQKFRRKVKQINESTIVSRKHWVAHVYDFDFDLLRILKIKAVQKKNHFIITER